MAQNILIIAPELQCHIMRQLNDDTDILNTRLANSKLAAACDDVFVDRFIKSRSHFYTKDSLELLAEISKSRYAGKMQNIQFVSLDSPCKYVYYDYAQQYPGVRDWTAADNAFRSAQHDLQLLAEVLSNVGAAGTDLCISLAVTPSATPRGAKLLVDAYKAIDEGPPPLNELAETWGNKDRPFETSIADSVNVASASPDYPLAGLDMQSCCRWIHGLSPGLRPFQSLPSSPWRNLKSLKLAKIETITDPHGELPKYLRSAHTLKDLQVRYENFTYSDGFEPWEPATTLLAQSTASLHSLHLINYRGSLKFLLQLLHKHRNTLRSLTLQDVRLTKPEDWISLIEELAIHFILTKQFRLIYPSLPRNGNEHKLWSQRGPFRHFYVGEQKFKYCVKGGEREIREYLRKLAAEGAFVEEGPNKSDRALGTKSRDEFEYLSEGYGGWEHELVYPVRCNWDRP